MRGGCSPQNNRNQNQKKIEVCDLKPKKEAKGGVLLPGPETAGEQRPPQTWRVARLGTALLVRSFSPDFLIKKLPPPTPEQV